VSRRVPYLTGALLALGLACAVGQALAQNPRPPIVVPRAQADPSRPLIVHFPEEPPAQTSGNAKPLDPTQMQLVREAQFARQAGRFADARAKLAALPAAVQSHPIVLTERARLDLAEDKLADVIRTATTERRAQKDSLLLGEELAEAYERSNKPREASLTAVEVWAAAQPEENWAVDVLLRTAPQDQHAGRDALRRAVTRFPDRSDLVRGLARLEAQDGDIKQALKLLGGLERQERGPRERWGFGEMLLSLGTPRDSSNALEAFLDVAGDASQEGAYRVSGGRRYWQLAIERGTESACAPRLYQAMKDLPAERWGGDLTLAVARVLRQNGQTAEARALLGPASGKAPPGVALERTLADLRDGPPERVLESLHPGEDASDDQRFHYAEALFFAGQVDSAKTWYDRVAQNPAGQNTGASLERLYLIEDGKPASALPAFGRIAYEQWRGANKRAKVLAESLWIALPHGTLWAQAAMIVADERTRAGDALGALSAVLAVADSLPDDRLAPLARQRAGDLYVGKLHDDAKAIEQYEACVARYPRAWNAPEVRRRLEELRRSRRF
jgi:tetratricopeptide (TPR) repeat protein